MCARPRRATSIAACSPTLHTQQANHTQRARRPSGRQRTTEGGREAPASRHHRGNESHWGDRRPSPLRGSSLPILAALPPTPPPPRQPLPLRRRPGGWAGGRAGAGGRVREKKVRHRHGHRDTDAATYTQTDTRHRRLPAASNLISCSALLSEAPTPGAQRTLMWRRVALAQHANRHWQSGGGAPSPPPAQRSPSASPLPAEGAKAG